MRSSKSRSRSKANRPRSIGNIINRVFDSSGPEGKVRGTPQQIIEKYLILARDAQLSNDRVAAENFLQHAEHYTRMLGEAQREMAAEQEERQRQYPQNGQNGNQNGGQYRDNQYRDNQNRDRGERTEYRNDRADFRPEPRDPGAGDQPELGDPVSFGDADSMLIDTPEMKVPEAKPRPDQRSDQRGENRDQPRREGENRVKGERRDFRERREPRPRREEAEPRQNAEPRPTAEAPAAPVTEAPAPAAIAPEPVVAPPVVIEPQVAPDVVEAEKPAAKPRKPAAPRKPRPKVEKPEGEKVAKPAKDGGKTEAAE